MSLRAEDDVNIQALRELRTARSFAPSSPAARAVGARYCPKGAIDLVSSLRSEDDVNVQPFGELQTVRACGSNSLIAQACGLRYCPKGAIDLVSSLRSEDDVNIQAFSELLVPIPNRDLSHTGHFGDFALGAALAG